MPGAAAGMVIPVHPATEKLSTAWVRRLVGNALSQTRGACDPLPLSLRAKYRLMSRQTALACIHFPARHGGSGPRRARRLAYEELLMLELFLMRGAAERARGREPVRHVTDGPRVRALASALPFRLTDEQAAARDDVLREMAAPRVANHLVLGDVGTGKTVVAAFALAAAADTGAQALLMAPTEVLARQHAASLGPLLEAAGVRVALLTGATPAAERAGIVARLAAGGLDVLVGTHALLEDDVACANLTLVVVDEQQRFGVEQRACLLAKGCGARRALPHGHAHSPLAGAGAFRRPDAFLHKASPPHRGGAHHEGVPQAGARARLRRGGGGAFARRAGVRGVPAGGQGRRRARRGRCGPARRGGGRATRRCTRR